MYFVLDNHFVILGGILLSFEGYKFYVQYFKTNLNTDHIDLVQLYVQRRSF